MRPTNILGERLDKHVMKRKNSQEDLAKALQKSRVSISDIERGRVEISAADLGWIAAHYDKPISFFFLQGYQLINLNYQLLTKNYFFFSFSCQIHNNKLQLNISGNKLKLQIRLLKNR